MSGSAPTYSADGVAIRQSNLSSVSEPNVTFERDELARKLDKREIDIVRKDKEIHQSNIEVLRMQKENKLAAAEIQNLRDRNETLQQSLMNSRLLSQNARNDAETVLNESRIRELEAALSAAIHKIKKGEAELEDWQRKWKDLDHSYVEAMTELNSIQDTKNEHRSELENAYAKVKTLQGLMSNMEVEKDAMNLKIIHLDQDVLEFRNTVASKQKEVDVATRDLAEAKGDVTKLKSVLTVRAETNGVLRAQLEEMNGNTFVISKTEMNKYKRVEREYNGQAVKLQELQRSLMLQMDIATKAEQDYEVLKEKANASAIKASELNMELMETRKKIGNTGDREKILKREVIKLRKEKAQLASDLTELQNDPLGHDEEAKRIRNQLIGTTKQKNEEYDEKVKEIRKRKLAEESLNALRNRISFLLEQQEQASALAVQWQEQKVIFKAEIEALHKTNNAIRTRLADVQNHFVNRHIPKLVEDQEYEETKGGNSNTGDVLSGKSGWGIDALGTPFDHAAANTFPLSVESFVERSLFDAVCAFSSGVRLQTTTNRKTDTTTGFKMKKGAFTLGGKKPKFKVQPTQKDPSRVEIILANASILPGKEEENAIANELLVGTQINSFLNFCQSRPPERATSLYAEKICSQLNFLYYHTQDMVDQLGSARLEHAQVASRMAVYDQRNQNLRLKYSMERTAKQKNALKYVREQMRLSDLRILFQDLHIKSNDHKEELELNGVAYLDTNKSLMSLLHEVEQVCKELSFAGASSGTLTGGPGALEIRLPDSEIDDETLYSLVGLLAGGLDEGKDKDDDDNNKTMETTGQSALESAKLTTGSGLTMMNSKVLSKAIRALSRDYISRIVMINLKGNCLTDISCKTLARLVNASSALRMIDLRENRISDEGAKILFDAVRSNVTIMYVTQRQNGFMIEGHREIQGAPGKKTKESETRAEMDRILDSAKFPLRIDVRFNQVNVEHIDPMFEQVDYSMFQASMKDRAEAATQQSVEAMATLAGMSPMRGVPASLKHPYAYSDSPRRDPHPSSPGVYGMQSPREHSQQLPGQNAPYLADSPYTKSHSRDNSVQARKMNAARISYSPRGLQASVAAEIKANGTREASTLGFLNQRVQDGTISGVPPRPQSASVVAGRTQIGARSMTSWRDHLDIEVENPVLSEQNEDSEIRRAGGGGDRENPNAGLIDLIENRAYGSSAGAGGGSGSNLGSLVDGQIRGETAGVGNMIDEEIRERQSTGPGLGSVGHDSVGGKKKKESQSVKERILDGTKRIYNNKNMFKEMAEPESLLEIMKRKGAGQGDKKVSTIPLALERGGGQISVNTASTVRSKLISARDKDDGIRMKHAGQNNELHPRDTSKRPASAPSGRSKREKGKAVSAHASKLMSSLQKLNPAVLF